MREKLLDLMKNEGLKPSQLAEMLGINPAGISHILAGRNKPGFDLLQKILRRFPRISPDWLLLDSGPMYRSDESSFSDQDVNSLTEAARQPELQTQRSAAGDLFDLPTSATSQAGAYQSAKTPDNTGSSAAAHNLATLAGKPTSVKRVVILYDDQTFESFTPGK